MNKDLFKVQLKHCVLAQKGTKPIVLRTKAFKDSVPYLDISALETNEIREYTLKELGYFSNDQDVLVVWDGSRCGLTLKGKSGVIGSTIMALTPIKLNSHYLYYFLKGKFTLINENSTGSGIPHVNSKDFFDIEIPYLPETQQKEIVKQLELKIKQNAVLLKEQKAIINSSLNDLDEEFNKNEDVSIALMNFKRSVLERAYNGELTAEWRKNNNTKTKPIKRKQLIKNNSGGLDNIPLEWDLSTIGSIAKCQRGKFSARPRNDPQFFGGDNPFIQIGDIPDDGGIISAHKQTLNEEGIKVSKCFKKGTVVIAIVGSTIGNSGILGYDMYFPDSIIGISPSNIVYNKFISYFLQKEKENIKNLSYSSGGQPNLKIEYINNYSIPLPPVNEQKEIVKKIEQLLKVIEKIQLNYLDAVLDFNKLEQAFFDKAFFYKDDEFNSDSVAFKKILDNLQMAKIELEMRRKVDNKIKREAKVTIKQAVTQKLELIEIVKNEKELTTEELWKDSKYYENKCVEEFYEELIQLNDSKEILLSFEDDSKMVTKIRVK